MYRGRFIYALLMTVVTAVGLASRSDFAAAWPTFLRAYAGDTLWALMVFLTLGFLFTSARTIHLVASAMLIAIAVECSQLITHPAVESVRATWPGAILLGHDFMWSDFACYAIGIALGAMIEVMRID